MQSQAGHFGLVTAGSILIIFLFSFLFASPAIYKEARGDEGGDVTKEIQELRQQMGTMEKKLEELEQKNEELEDEAKKQKEEKELEKAISQPSPPKPEVGGFVKGLVQSLNPDISALGIFAAAYFSKNPPAPQLAETDPANTGVNLQEFELGFQGVVDPYFRADSFITFTLDSVGVEEAYLTTLSLPFNLQIRAGKMRSKFGKLNLQHTHVQDFVDIALPNGTFINGELSPVGVEFNYLLPLPWYAELSASINSPEGEGPTFVRSSDSNNIGLLLYTANLTNFFELSDVLSASVIGSIATGSNGTDTDNRSTVYDGTLFIKYRPLQNSSYQAVKLQAEFLLRQATIAEGRFTDWGAYAYILDRFAQRWDAGFRFDFVNSNKQFPSEQPGELFPAQKEYRYSALLRFSPSEFSRIELQYDFYNPSFRSNFNAVFLQFQYAIGAHGAHPF
jgi:cell division protein FtsB